MITTGKAPNWLLEVPEPKIEPRKFNTKMILGWLGKAPITQLQGWTDNPRIDIPVENWKEEHAGRDPDNEDLLDIMMEVSEGRRAGNEEKDEDADNRRSRRNRLLQLAENIRLNGIRIPLVVTYDKRILDGNRRYFANLYLYNLTEDEDERELYSELPVWVLPKGISRKDEDRILTELNSINDCYVQWPYSVVAKRIYQDYKDGMSVDELARKYHDYTKDRIRNIIEASKVSREFLEYYDDDVYAREVAYDKLIWFDELRRSNANAMGQEAFRTTIYDLIMADNSPFSSHRDFKRLGEVYNNQEAWGVLVNGQGKEALRQALYIVDRDRYEEGGDAQSKMARINGMLKALTDGAGFLQVRADTLAEFHEAVVKVPNPKMDLAAKMEVVTNVLNSLTSKEVAQLTTPFVRKLASVLERVKKQAESYREK